MEFGSFGTSLILILEVFFFFFFLCWLVVCLQEVWPALKSLISEGLLQFYSMGMLVNL